MKISSSSKKCRKLTPRKTSTFEDVIYSHQGKMVCLTWGQECLSGRFRVEGDTLKMITTLNEVVFIRISNVSGLHFLTGDASRHAHHEMAENIADPLFGVLDSGDPLSSLGVDDDWTP